MWRPLRRQAVAAPRAAVLIAFLPPAAFLF
jgi:hypothetical protein